MVSQVARTKVHRAAEQSNNTDLLSTKKNVIQVSFQDCFFWIGPVYPIKKKVFFLFLLHSFQIFVSILKGKKLTLSEITLREYLQEIITNAFFSSPCLFQDKKKYLDIIHSYMEVHGTVHGTSTVHLPGYVKNHGILSGRDLQFLLRETKVSPPGYKSSYMKKMTLQGNKSVRVRCLLEAHESHKPTPTCFPLTFLKWPRNGGPANLLNIEDTLCLLHIPWPFFFLYVPRLWNLLWEFLK